MVPFSLMAKFHLPCELSWNDCQPVQRRFRCLLSFVKWVLRSSLGHLDDAIGSIKARSDATSKSPAKGGVRSGERCDEGVAAMPPACAAKR